MENKNVFVNQIGYSVDRKKLSYIKESLAESEKTFNIKNINSGTVVYSAEVKVIPSDNLTEENILLLDFSDFKIPGKYILCVGKNDSYPFEIYEGKSEKYDDFYFSLLRYFYLSRCGQKFEDELWGHEACHTKTAEIYGTNKRKSVIGGWHDAGDYGRYIVAASKAVMDLLLAYEVKNDYSKFDILDEVRFELEWMLQLQRDDGGVYHKISCYNFCGFILPENETDELVISPVSTSATADFAGCLAFASKFYKQIDAKFSNKLLKAALKAQNYLDCHEDELFKNPTEITTGTYGDTNVKDERYFALCSLFAVTGNYKFLQDALEIRKRAMAVKIDPENPWKNMWLEYFSWACVAGYGTEILLKNSDLLKKVVVASEGTLAAGEAIIKELQDSIVLFAQKRLERSRINPFGLGTAKLCWGSNGDVSDAAHLFLLAYEITKNIEFYNAACRHLDYLLGCNPFGICYVTGNGYYSPVNPHHRPSAAIGKVMPGMVVGGPCEYIPDETAKKYLTGKPPLQCYIDHIGSYSTNEVAIYWNSPLVYVIAKLGLV